MDGKASAYAVALATAFALGLPAVAQAVPYSVSVNARVLGFTGLLNNQTPLNTGTLQQTAYSFDINQSASTDVPICGGSPQTCLTGNETGTGAATGSVTPGAIHLSLISTSTTNPTTPTVLGNSNPLGAEGQAQASIAWTDTITIVSSTLAPGTAVSLRFTLSLHGSLGVSGDNLAAAHIQDANSADVVATLSPGVQLATPLVESGGIVQGGTFDGNPNFPAGDFTTIGLAFVGTPFTISGSMDGLTQANTEASANTSDVTSFLNAMNTAETFIDILTPGASLQSASGSTYDRVSVPEPSTLALSVATLILVGRRRLPDMQA